MITYSNRYSELNAVFTPGKNISLPDVTIDIRFYPFTSSISFPTEDALTEAPSIGKIYENQSFEYPVFVPRGCRKSDQAILLLHGLNERSWNKYLTWAEYLCSHTGKPVILFPLAFHINRSPQSWSNPRSMQSLMNLRRKQNGDDRSISFANAALSERMSLHPLLFYTSGRQTFFDMEQLCINIRQGKHPLFTAGTDINIFAYSIGAFLAQVMLMTDPGGIFSDTKLFMFCGGSIFSSMVGISRSIMDKSAFDKLHKFYLTDFENTQNLARDKVFRSFYSMISPDRNQTEREDFFNQMGDRLLGISLKQDTVIPFEGVLQALGSDCTRKCISLEDFSFLYTHENPFPIGAHTNQTAVNDEFKNVFFQAAGFLA
ncbi:MAG: hypothetical protein H6Q19_713 [Bacteroidetes bacterium]|nr:hypothetical protein [Bacteroidota bacterium]